MGSWSETLAFATHLRKSAVDHMVWVHDGSPIQT